METFIIKVRHLIDNEKVSTFTKKEDFIHFVRGIAIENEDFENSILSVFDAKEYLEIYSDNLEIL
jgi:hypothetical protein